MSDDGIVVQIMANRHMIPQGTKVTFSDASYLSTVIDRNLVLVTDEGGLLNSAGKHVKVKSSGQL
ncbi:MAG: hypothetical protein M1442_04450 [Candidatus Thermoplasmatota archaeon]|nr:hypothetical protein [Candidatus Thermoplasmatota archaeon]